MQPFTKAGLLQRFNKQFGGTALLLFRDDSPETTGMPIFRTPGESDGSWKYRATTIQNLNAESSWVEVDLFVSENEERIGSTLKTFHKVSTQEMADRAMLFLNVAVWRVLEPSLKPPVVGEA
jgi:hypothetical protein